jgi:NADPH-dependent curcumin reductase CurA
VLDRLCPKGIDVDFENVGGAIMHAVFARMNNFGRMIFCGAISEYQDATPRPGPEKMFAIVQKRMGEFVSEVGPLLKAGRIRHRETIVDGLENAPAAFMGLLKGENFGKLIVRIA